jgi:hypothetical protein
MVAHARAEEVLTHRLFEGARSRMTGRRSGTLCGYLRAVPHVRVKGPRVVRSAVLAGRVARSTPVSFRA